MIPLKRLPVFCWGCDVPLIKISASNPLDISCQATDVQVSSCNLRLVLCYHCAQRFVFAGSAIVEAGAYAVTIHVGQFELQLPVHYAILELLN